MAEFAYRIHPNTVKSGFGMASTLKARIRKAEKNGMQDSNKIPTRKAKRRAKLICLVDGDDGGSVDCFKVVLDTGLLLVGKTVVDDSSGMYELKPDSLVEFSTFLSMSEVEQEFSGGADVDVEAGPDKRKKLSFDHVFVLERGRGARGLGKIGEKFLRNL